MKKILLVLITFFMFININALNLDLNSKYIYVYNLTEDKEMFELNSKEEAKVASMTKIMTAILVIENNKNLEEVITIKDEDLRDMYEYTTTGFQSGDEVTIKELLYGILLRSGADAVNAAVRITTEKEEDFVFLMNQKVKELNLKNTYFSNAVGKDKDNYSSAHDIAKIMEYCLKNETFKEIISTPMHYIERLDIQINGPLYKMDKKYDIDLSLINGGKSGFTTLAKHSLVSYGEKDNITYIIVTNYADSYKDLLMDNYKLYNHFFNNYGYKEYKFDFDIDISDSEEKKYNVDINTLLYLENTYDENLLSYKYEGVNKITFLNRKGSKLGKVSIYYGEELIKEIDIKLNKSIKYEKEAYVEVGIFGIIIFIVIGITFLIIIRTILKKKKNKKNIKNKKQVKVVKEKIKKEIQKEEEKNIEEENSFDKKLQVLKTTNDINIFFDILKEINTDDKYELEKKFIDRCFQNIDFENLEQLQDLYKKLKHYKKNMDPKTINYYTKLFKYCVDEYVDKK